MNVLLLSANFYPEKTGISVTATDCARFIADLGHEVTVVCGMPYYPEWKIREEYKGKIFASERLDSFSLKRVWLHVPKKASPLRRVLHELSFSALASLRCLFMCADLHLCISPPFTSAFASAIVALIRRKAFWVYVQDIQPDAAFELGMLRNKVLIKVLFACERFIYERSQRVLVLSEGMKKNLLRKSVPVEKIFVVPASIEVQELARTRGENGSFWNRYGVGSKFVALYSGNIGVKQDPRILVECAKLLRDESDVFVAIVGDGALRDEVAALICKYGLSNIGIYPLCDRSELGHMLQSANVLLAPQRKEVVDFVMPSKLLAYFTSKRPVIASAHCESEVARLFLDAGLGYLVEPEKPEALARAVLETKKNPEGARLIAERAFEYVLTNHSHEVVFEKYYRPLFALDSSPANVSRQRETSRVPL